MALCLTESFEGGSISNKWNLHVWNNTAASPSRTGAYGAGNGIGAHQVAASREHATFIVGMAVYPIAFGGQRYPLVLMSDAGATTHLTITFETDGSVKVFRGDSVGTLLGQSPAAFTAGTYQYLEVKATLNDTTGAVEVRRDETTILSLSGVDTKNGGTKAVFDSFGVTNQFVGDVIYDDIYLCNGAGSTDNDFLGAVHVEALKPNGNGSNSAGVNDAGNSTNNYTHVNDASDTTYVDESATGDTDTYAFADSAFPTGNVVKGVMVYARSEKTDAGARGLDLVALQSGTQVTATPPGSLANGAVGVFFAPFETKPAGGAWTVADVNATEFGTKAT